MSRKLEYIIIDDPVVEDGLTEDQLKEHYDKMLKHSIILPTRLHYADNIGELFFGEKDVDGAGDQGTL